MGCDSKQAQTGLAGPEGPVTSIAFTAPTGKHSPRAVTADHVTSLAFSTDGKTLAAGCGDRVMLWEMVGPDAGRPAAESRAGDVIDTSTSVAFSPRRQDCVAAGYRRDQSGGVLIPGSIQRRSRLAEELLRLGRNVTSIALSSDGTTIAVAYDQGNRGWLVLWGTRRRASVTCRHATWKSARLICHERGDQSG